MNQQQIQHLFQQAYAQSNWKSFLAKVFNNVRLYAEPEILTGISKDVAEKAVHLGHVIIDEGGVERQIACYDVTLAPGIILERNRVGLRNLLRKFWKDIDAAFIVYHRPDTSVLRLSSVEPGSALNWRFTYVSELTGFDAEGELIKVKTEPKRYTYILGEGESCRTAAQRFEILARKGSEITLDDVKEAFSVEKLSKSFFNEYKEHYEQFCDFMVGKPFIRQTIFNGDEKSIRDFVKKMLGRIVFLHFIQKKGWMGVPEGKRWGDGDQDFLWNLFDKCRNKNLFYSDYLIKLFFDTLNTERNNDEIELIPGQKIRIPYLNGGLFEEDKKQFRKLNFPSEMFEELFNFFKQYNFTIYEDDPNDHTVAVDPEMLGHIFENLLEDNKDKGAYYTPKEIVHYMCQESLIEYLCTSLGIDGDEAEAKAKEKEAIEYLIKKKEIDEVLITELDSINEALDKVKICDPAIGSGAFPMGLLKEIFSVKQLIYTFEHGNTEGFDSSAVKLNIIQNSIYGVDIEKGAVDIARLRFWLSLVVDDEEPKPLPNLDYKIVVGNSLVSKLGDDIIDIDWSLNETEQGLFGSDLAIEKTNLLKRITSEQKQFFDPASDKKKLAKDIRDLKIDLLINQLELMVKTKGLDNVHSVTGRELKKQTQLLLETKGWKQQIQKLKQLKSNPDEKLQFFEWKLDFPDVMNREITKKNGFDIIIANPPYLDYRLIDNNIRNHKNYPINNDSFRPNLYQYFIELSDELLNIGGTFCFINPNHFLSTDNGRNLREHLVLHRTIKFIVDVSYLKVFREVATYTILWQYTKKVFDSNKIRVNRCQGIDDLSQSSFSVKQEDINLTESKIIPINLEFFTLAKIELGKNILKDIASLKWGTSASGYGNKKLSYKVYDSLPGRSKHLYKPILQTSDTKKYYINWKQEYIPLSIYSEKIKKEFTKPKIVIGRLTKSIQACIDYEQRCVGKSTIITDSKMDLKLLLGILNSSFANKWYYFKFETTHMSGGYLRYDIPYLEKLPIPEISETDEKKIIELVEKIIKKKSVDVSLDTSELEQKIDLMVYKLYQFTYGECKIFDPGIEKLINREDYDRMGIEELGEYEIEG